MIITKIFGPPGTGKTTRLLELLDETLKNGIPPDKIAFVSFTKKAVEEANSRVVKEFKFSKKDLQYFRTIHSLCFQQLGLSTKNVIKDKHYDEIGKLLGIKFSHGISLEDGPPEGYTGDTFSFCYQLAKARRISLKQQWEEMDLPQTYLQLKQYEETYNRYKTMKGLFDYTDMLERFLIEGQQINIHTAFIDEAQDLNPLQWEVILKAFPKAKHTYIAGDDDQSIYKWAGADTKKLLNIEETEQEILPQSYRVPKKIQVLAHSIISKVSIRVKKNWQPRNEEGTIQHHNSFEGVDLDTSKGTWFILARNRYFLKNIENSLREKGLLYSKLKYDTSINPNHYKAIVAWEKLRKGEGISRFDVDLIFDALGTNIENNNFTGMDGIHNFKDLERYGIKTKDIWHSSLIGISTAEREYYLSILRNGYKLSSIPKIHINTIHGVKGGEADSVVLLTDMTTRSHKGFQIDEDSERRVFYVGITRARKNLHIILPQGQTYFPLDF